MATAPATTRLPNIKGWVYDDDDSYCRVEDEEAREMVTDAYDPAKTYKKGETSIQDNKLYRAKVDITTAEIWTPDHWEETSIEQIRAEMAAEISKANSDISALNANKNILASATFTSPNRIESDSELDNINVPSKAINISMAHTNRWQWGFAITMNIDGVYLIQAYFAGQTLALRYCPLPSRDWIDWVVK